MNTRDAKQRARAWVQANRPQWPGLRAAHLVGSITTMADDAPWPAHKDVDFHLIFDEGSPALAPTGPFPTLIEVPYDGLLIEAGLKSVAAYRSAETVLANPEIAHHLTVDSVLYDPSGLLRDLMPVVQREFGCRHWVQARLAHERAGMAGALAMVEMVGMTRPTSSGSGEAMILGYTSTFLSAALSVAVLQSPTTGSRLLPRASRILAEQSRCDLYEAFLRALGLAEFGPRRAAQCLEEAASAFDLAVTVRRSPHPFQHKLHAHLRPYFVESCRYLLAAGKHREALHWVTPFYHASTDMILADGPPEVKDAFAARHARFMADLGMDSAEARAGKFEEMRRVTEEIFALTDAIAQRYPDATRRGIESYAAP